MDSVTTQIDYRSLHEFRYSIRRFIHFSEEAARAAGFEPQQQQLMLAVKGMPEGMAPTIGNLAERLQIRHHSCVELIDRLVASGDALRHRNEADRREVLVQLTPSGEQHLRELTLHHQAELRAAGPALARVLGLVVDGGSPKTTSAAAHELAMETAGSTQ